MGQHTHRTTRRGLLGTTTTAGVGSLAGCTGTGHGGAETAGTRETRATAAQRPSPGQAPETSAQTGRGFEREYRIGLDDGEAALREAFDQAGYGDRIVLAPGYSQTIQNGTLSLSKGVHLEGTAGKRRGEPATLIKGFDGPVLQYDDWNTIRSVRVDGNRSEGFEGRGIVPTGDSTRDVFVQQVTARENAAGGFVHRKTYLSNFISCDFSHNRDGLVIEGDGHGPHTKWDHCRMSYNDRAGIDVRYNTDQQKFIACLIDQNTYGFDTARGKDGAKMWRTAIGGGTRIQRNRGPGIVCQGKAEAVRFRLSAGSAISGNNQEPPDSLTASQGVGDIHAENGGEIRGYLGGQVGHIRRYNSNGRNTTLTVAGSAGDIVAPDTKLVVLNDQKVGDVSVTSGIGLDPTRGGSVTNY